MNQQLNETFNSSITFINIVYNILFLSLLLVKQIRRERTLESQIEGMSDTKDIERKGEGLENSSKSISFISFRWGQYTA